MNKKLTGGRELEGRHIKRRGLRRSLSHDQPGRALRGARCKATGMVLHVSLPKATRTALPASRPQVAATSTLLLGACAPLDVRALWKPFFRETPNPPAQAFSADRCHCARLRRSEAVTRDLHAIGAVPAADQRGRPGRGCASKRFPTALAAKGRLLGAADGTALPRELISVLALSRVDHEASRWREVPGR